jgi:hypothetical protein
MGYQGCVRSVHVFKEEKQIELHSRVFNIHNRYHSQLCPRMKTLFQLLP